MQLYQPTITGSLSVSGSVITNGTITATTLVVQTVTSSVSYLTGSTQFGSLSSNTHTFTGSLLVTGSVGVGVTPYNNTLGPAFDMRNGAGLFGYGDAAYLTGNMYFDGAWRVKNAGTGSQITLAGEITFNTSNPTGSAGVTVTNTERMRITNAGNVGIGVNYPNSQLFIGGQAAQTTAALTDSGTRAGLISVLTSGGSAGGGGGIVLGTNTQGNATGYGQVAIKSLLVDGANQGTSDLAFSTRNATTDTALTERMRITSAGQLVINRSTASGYRFEVNGDIFFDKSDGTYIALGYNTSVKGYLGIASQIVNGGSANDIGIFASNNISLATGGSNTERLKIGSAGAITWGNATYMISGTTGFRFNNSTDAFNNFIALDNGNATLRGTLTQNSSDERLKNNIQIIPNAIEKISQLKGVTFEWNQELYETSRTTDIGVIAQDVQKVLPDAVALAPFDTNFEDNTSKSGENYLTVYYEKLIPLLIEGIKELKAEIETLKNK